MWLWHLFLLVTGTSNVSGPWYGFWSGFAGDISLFVAVAVFYKKHNCHVRWCPSFGHTEWTHPVTGVSHKVCRRHHPQHEGRRQLRARDLREFAIETYPELRDNDDTASYRDGDRAV